MTPRATYRLQLSKDFGFEAAAQLADYLQELGISHLYSSPWLMSRPGSTHGYDLIDPTQMNPELGGERGFARLAEALEQHGLQHLLDFIPNHMGVGVADNEYWLDVLEWGRDSAYADWFDIDWRPDSARLKNKLLVPFLGNQYGIELESGALKLIHDQENGSFAVWAYATHKFPVCPRHYDELLGKGNLALERLGDEFAHLPPRHREPDAADHLKKRLAALFREDAAVRDTVNESLQRFAGIPGCGETWRHLDTLIQQQHWRPAYFRVASDDINYRRFFNVNELAAVRMEHAPVFQHMHRLVFDLVKAKALHGLRIDHVDGLRNPREYLERLRTSLNALSKDDPPYVVVEKILAPHESLREDWPVEGTTGYDFAVQITGALMDPAGESGLTRIYGDFTGERRNFLSILTASKRQIIENEMAGELHALAREAVFVARQNPHTMDFTRNVLQRALKQIVACFPVYRIYVDQKNGPAEEDRRDLHWAVEQARTRETDIDSSVFDFLTNLLTGDLTSGPSSGFSRSDVLRCAMRFQQYTVPIMAKGLEDTAFYRYNRCLALNEVGGRPDQFAFSFSALHKANAGRQKRWPATMLGTSTHDTKLGEDVRARLAVLSEIPEEWERQIQAWTRILRVSIGGVEGDAPPDRNDEYRFYQLLIGTWPAELTLPKEIALDSLAAYAKRLSAAMLKSAREAKMATNWLAPDAAYESALTAFVERALDAERSQTFLSQFLPFQERVARMGVYNSLFQAVVKLTAPGVPDIYQGSELWDLNMVDPDNRRAVNYEARRQLLARHQAENLADLMTHWHDGAIKQHVIARLLRFRRAHPALFTEGSYQPLSVQGPGADRILAFLRERGSERVVVMCARFPSRERDGWADTKVALPEGEWKDLLTDIPAGELFQAMPVAVLVPRA